jgi:hypothetical protein
MGSRMFQKVGVEVPKVWGRFSKRAGLARLIAAYLVPLHSLR